MPPNRSSVMAYISFTSSSLATSTRRGNADPSGQRPTVSSARPKSMSATHTLAPSPVNTIAPSRPMPPPAPVITQTLPSSLPAIVSALRRDEHVLHVGIPLERGHTELPPEAGLLHASEGGVHADRAVRVDGQDPGIDRAGDAERASAVARPDRTREAVGSVVRDPDRIGLVRERDHCGDR